MSIEFDDKQARFAAADLCERAAKLLREEDEEGDTDVAEIIGNAHEMVSYAPTFVRDNYECGLANANVSKPDRDAAVVAISEGRHPPDSLPGRVVEAIKPAFAVYNAAPSAGSGEARGKLEALNNALRWIGVMR